MKPYDVLLVGAGLYSAVFAWKLTQHRKKCLVVERRNHIGGNIYCEKYEGINIHKYGAHIFHTSNHEIWNIVTNLVPFKNFINSPLARYGNKLYNLPFNMNTFYQMWGCTSPDEAIRIIETQREREIIKQTLNGHNEAQNLEEQALRLVGRDIYETLIKGYTEKQWGRSCDKLPSFIINRIPVRLTFNNNYFNDLYQGIPIGGYNPLIQKLFASSDIILGCDYIAHRSELQEKANTVVYTGAIDEYFDYIYGKLEYRSIKLDTELIPVANWQGNAVVNYTGNETPFTRIIEHKHFEMSGDEIYNTPVSVISREYSLEWQKGHERYYPINDERNTKLYKRYSELAQKELNVIFGGRLAEYRYYDMDKVIIKALADAKIYLSNNP